MVAGQARAEQSEQEEVEQAIQGGEEHHDSTGKYF